MFTYDFFHFVKPLPPPQLNFFFVVMIIFSLLFSIGIFYRLTSVVLFIGISYTFLLGKIFYNNHYYLFVLICFLMIFIDANKWGKLSFRNEKQEHKTVAYWNIFLLQIQLFIVYFFGGIAKLNYDWLVEAEPMATWLSAKSNYAIVGGFFATKFAHYFFSYGGLLFDLSIGFLLFFRKTRYWALIPLLFFHITNSQIFHIGYFPWFMIGATVLFFDPDWIEKLIKRITGESTLATKAFLPENISLKQKITASLVLMYIVIQILLPLRHLLIPGSVYWTGEAHRFSWMMKIRTKRPVVAMKAIIPGDPQTYYISLQDYISANQIKYLGSDPAMAPVFAQYFADGLKKDGVPEVAIYAEIWTKLNGNPIQLYIDSTIDLTKVQAKNYLGHRSWIMPFDRNAVPPRFEFNEEFE